MRYKRSVGLISITLFLAVFLMGCGASFRGRILKATDEHIADIQASMEVTKKIVEVMPYEAAFIKGALGQDINLLSAEAVYILDEMEGLPTNPETMTNLELGAAGGMYLRFWSKPILDILEMYAPDVLEFLLRVL